MNPHPLNQLLAEAQTHAQAQSQAQTQAHPGSPSPLHLTDDVLARLDAYLALLLRWNARTNLTAIRNPDEILRRHFLESILAARALPVGIRTLLDFGSGAGFPGLPIALCRPEIAVTLAESQHKKAAFLREAVRTLQLSVAVHADRAESLAHRFDCVTLRAVDRMPDALAAATPLLAPNGWLAVLTTHSHVETIQETVARAFPGISAHTKPDDLNKSIYMIAWGRPIALAPGTERTLLLGQQVFA